MEADKETEAFIARISALPEGPGVDLTPALQPSLEYEEGLRQLFANDKSNQQISNRYVGLVDLFATPETIKKTKARVVKDAQDLSFCYVFPLTEKQRRKEGAPCMVSDLDEFRKNWSIFTEGSLSQLIDWNNVVAAGGSVLACLAPLDKQHTVSKRATRKHYHTNAYPSSDVDLFIYGLDAKQAEAKMQSIYEAVRDSNPWDITCIRTKHTISIHSQYPYRAVQIVLRLYQSPAEVLAGFDVDAPCCAYDGKTVWASPRSIVAMMRQCNTVDMSRRSPSYEIRLAKYANRGYEVLVPNLKREAIDPTIYERSIAKMTGLARLLVLEKLATTDTRLEFLDSRRNLRGRPAQNHPYINDKKLKGDLKADDTIAGLALNNYDVTTLHVPYGQKWDARRIDKLVYQTDLGMNSTFNPKNKKRRLHRHPAFFGTLQECIEDCCEMCPEPIDDDERKLQEAEDEQYIRGRIKFIEENPGRQTISGSFHPIDDGEWSEQVYLKPTQKLFAAIAQQDRSGVQKLLSAEDIDLQQRDHVGRSSLHFAIITGSSDIACDLIQAGARITARLVDGRTPLHLAAQYGNLAVTNKLFLKNAVNVAEDKVNNPEPKEEEKSKEAETKKPEERPSSEDDWSSHSDDEDVDMAGADEDKDNDVQGDGNEGDDQDGDDGDGDGDGEDEDGKEDEDGDDEANDAPARTPSPAPGDILDDEDEPDIIDINQFEFDFGISALGFAVLFAPIAVVEKLIKEGADVKLPSKNLVQNDTSLHPLAMTALREDEDDACRVAEALINAGATCTTVNDTMMSIMHYFVVQNKAKLLATVLKCEEKAVTMLNFPTQTWSDYVLPVVNAIEKRNYASLAVLISHDAKLAIEEKDIAEAQEVMPSNKRYQNSDGEGYLQRVYQPIEIALAASPEAFPLLVACGASINFGTKSSLQRYSNSDQRRTIVEWVQLAINNIKRQILKLKSESHSMDTQPDATPSPWKSYLRTSKKSQLKQPNALEDDYKKKLKERKLKELEEGQQYFEEVLRILQAHKAQKWKVVYPDIESTATADAQEAYNYSVSNVGAKKEWTCSYLTTGYGRQSVPNHLLESYEELFDACYAGDDDKVKQLCMPSDVDLSKRPLKVAVRIDQSSNSYDQQGFTPLAAAALGGKWTTCRLLLSIVTAQYRPEDPKERSFKASKIKFNDSDSDEENEDADDDSDSDMTEDGKPKFIDIATQSTTVHSPIKPSEILEHKFYYEVKPVREWSSPHTLLSKAVVDGNTDTFTRIANLYQAISHPLEPSHSADLLALIVEQDRPEILDLYIKRTGHGIDFEHAQKHSETPPAPTAINDKNRLYLGLNVHGMKRADLAKQNDPDANKTEPQAHIPLVWRASQTASHQILRYLASDKPAKAFQQYASTNIDERAVWLKRVGGVSGSGIEKHIPVWLGWTTTRIGESPLSATIVGKQNCLKTIELLMDLRPEVMTPTFNTRIAIVNWNMLLLAVRRNSSRRVIDFLLNKSNSPTHHTHDGFNIYHCLARSDNFRLFEHFLGKLPKDVSEQLLLEQGNASQHTPLHAAVDGNHLKIVKMILNFNKSSLLLREIHGSTVLHLAVRNQYLELFEVLCSFVTDPSVFFMEDSVGHTIIDIVTAPEISERINSAVSSLGRGYMNGLDSGNHISLRGPWSLDNRRWLTAWRQWERQEADRLLREVRYVRGIMDTVVLPEERKKRRTKVVWEFNKFIDQLDARMKKVMEVSDKERAERKQSRKKKKVAGEETDDEDEDEVDDGEEDEEEKTEKFFDSLGAETTLRSLLVVVRDIMANHPDQKRQLIHVADVQDSVSSALEQAKKKAAQPKYITVKDAEGLVDEDARKEKQQQKELKQSMLGPYVTLDDGMSDHESTASD
ncbi:hypothetical protein CPB83DRAFT_849901 [Crepidotus variabilis]|uniref:Ankyrin repeat protein n=1 Tax=Crepidotus variabilis TaxID=179855 RepID=A0A9P6ELE5_9AGAR|nr:hypothetical protein CPB83DRAFT_849901 [Crepidotus variabilis]